MPLTDPPAITNPPTAPTIASPSTFEARMDAWIAWIAIFVAQIVAALTWFRDTAAAVLGYATAAEAASTAAVAAAHYKGAWSGLSGPLALPASVSHSGKIWMLLSALADVTASEPGVAVEWQVLTGSGGRQARWIPANEMTPRTTAGAAWGAVQSASGIMIRTLDFDAATTEYAQVAYRMPKRWDGGTVTFRPVWSIGGIPTGDQVGGTYSYTHAYGSGNRTASITVSSTFTISGTLSEWVNGDTGSSNTYVTASQAATGKQIKFVFPAHVCIDQFKIYAESTQQIIGTFSWEGSNDGATWTTLTTGLVVMSAGGTTTYNVTPGVYLQYRLYGTSGTSATGRVVFEFEFRVGDPAPAAETYGVAWATRAVALSDGGALTTAFGDAITVVDAWQSLASAALIGDESSALTIGNTPAAEDVVVLEVFRDVSHTADVINVDACLHGVTLYWASTSATDD